MTFENYVLGRRLLIEQTRKETLDEILEYKVGVLFEKEVEKGIVFVIPDDKYRELFGGKP